MGGISLEIICTVCGADPFVRREPVYDGFVKKGEVFICASCGHRYTAEAEVPFKQKTVASIFTDADKSGKVNIFKGDELGKNCRHCRHYVVNPFTQRCGLHNRIVQATDVCDKFKAAEEKGATPAANPDQGAVAGK